MLLVIVLMGGCFSESFSQPITGNTNVTVGSTSLKARWKAFGLSTGALNINCIANNINTGYTMKIAFKKSGVRDTVNYYPFVTGNKPSWINRQSDSMFVWCLDSLSTMTFSIEQTPSSYPAPSLQMNDASGGSSDTTTYVPKYGDFTVEDTKTFRDSTILEGKIMNRGTATQRPMIRSFYSDAGTPTYVDVGQIGVGEFNAAINFDYSQGLHWYYDTSRAASSLTTNLGADSILCWQWIPKGYGNQPSQPDAWALSGNTTPWRVNSQGFMGVIGGYTSIFKRQGNPTFGTSTATDYNDTNKVNFGGRGGKSFVDWKFGVGTETPYGTFHTVNKSTTRATSNYGTLSDWVLQDDGASDRAQLELRSPNGSLIAFGDQTTYNSAYVQYVNGTSTLSLNSSIINLAGTIQENGTSLASKYAQLGASNTLTGALNNFAGKIGINAVNNFSKLTVVGDTLFNFRSSLFGGTDYTGVTDSSSFSLLSNPFTGSMRLKLVGKTGNNQITIDSTRITSDLAVTTIGDITTGGNIFAGSNNKVIGWTSRSSMKSGSDGVVTITNNAETTGARLIFGTATLNNLPTYADNAAALGGGLTAGQLYKTSTGVLMVTY